VLYRIVAVPDVAALPQEDFYQGVSCVGEPRPASHHR
jgi:hypothetical protein